jgi:hypothetical protein
LVNNTTPTVTTPTYTYVSQDDLNTNGGSPNDVIGRVLSIRNISSSSHEWIWQSTSGIELTFYEQEADGNQGMKIDLRHDFRNDDYPNNPFLNYETTFYSSSVIETWVGKNFLYNDFSYDGIRITSIGFVGDAEPASYVSQGMVITNYDCEYTCQDSGGWDDPWDLIKRDVWVMVAGDPTQSGDMPSSGSASYNVIGQMVVVGYFEDQYYTPYYVQGDGSFSADFSARTLSGSMLWDDVAGCCGTKTDERKANMSFGGTSFDGTITGVQFSGDATWGDSYGTGSFSGGFFGPNASDIGGVFDLRKDNDDEAKNGDYFVALGTFTGCKTC